MKRLACILLIFSVSVPGFGSEGGGRTMAVQTTAPAANATSISEEEFRAFLKTAQVKERKQTAKGITSPFKLTLSDGQRTMDASFQAVEIFRPRKKHPSYVELEFRDSYRFNIASYQLAKLLGLDGMIPPTVEYQWNGKEGALSWWIPAKWDEEDRLKENAAPPDPVAWDRQVSRMWVFSQLVYDTDRNQTNMLITEDWKLWMIDFTRAFRLETDLKDAERLVVCDRKLLEKLRQLNEAQVLEKTKAHLKKKEVKVLMTRRDLIVAHFERLIAEKGEGKVLY